MSRKFFRELRKKGRSFLSAVRVSVCGLGSTDYSQFCEGGIKLRRLLVDKEKGAGADEILPLAKVDDVNFEEHVEAWKDALHAKLKELHAQPTDNDRSTAQPQQSADNAAPAASAAALPAAVPAAAVGSAAAAAAAAPVAAPAAAAPAPVPVGVSSSSAPIVSSGAPVGGAVSASAVASPAAANASASAASASALSSQSASRARSGWAPPTPSSSASLDFASFIAEHSSSPSALSPALILYATVTGNAESIAQQVAERWRAAWPNEPLRVLSTEQLMQQPENVNAQRHTATDSDRQRQRSAALHCTAGLRPDARINQSLGRRRRGPLCWQRRQRHLRLRLRVRLRRRGPL